MEGLVDTGGVDFVLGFEGEDWLCEDVQEMGFWIKDVGESECE